MRLVFNRDTELRWVMMGGECTPWAVAIYEPLLTGTVRVGGGPLGRPFFLGDKRCASRTQFPYVVCERHARNSSFQASLKGVFKNSRVRDSLKGISNVSGFQVSLEGIFKLSSVPVL